ncbi:MAG: DUF3047 domain-containing protein [Geminicoccaceae bacterium]
MFNAVRLPLPYVFALLISFLFWAGSAIADVDERLQAEGWDELIFDNKTANRFISGEHGEIEVKSESGVSLLKMPLTVDIKAQPGFRWRWRVVKGAPATDLSVKGADDRSLAMYVAFPFVAEGATTIERIKRKFVEARAGKDAPGRVLTYVFGGDGDRGAVIESPYLGNSGMMTILRSADAPTDQWFTETINLAEDYQRAFGTLPPDPLYIAIGADTDDTNSVAVGVVKDLEFLAPDRLF